MDLHTLSVVQLKNILRAHGHPTTGKKAELIGRMQKVDPTDAWIQEAAKWQGPEEEHEDTQLGANAVDDNSALTRPATEDEWLRRELRMVTRERDLMQREGDLLRRENEYLRQSPRSSVTLPTVRTSIKEVSSLLCEYTGAGEDFTRWKAQVNLLRQTYDLDENASRILIGSKLRGRANEWYSSVPNHLASTADVLLEKMGNMFDQPLGKRERRRIAEDHQWKKNELFSDYCHDKLIAGYKVPVDDDEAIDFIIDGIPSAPLRNQARMHRFSSVRELCDAFRLIKLEDAEPMADRREYTGAKDTKPKQTMRKITSSTKESAPKLLMAPDREARCFECNQPGHYIRDCPRKKGNAKMPPEQKMKSKVSSDAKKKSKE